MSAPAFFARWRVRLGYPLAIIVLVLAHPTPQSILYGALVGSIGLLIRALAAGHLHKQAVLTITGPYAHTRNPLYLGSLVMATGFAFAARSWWMVGILVVMFVAIYLPVIRAEETFLAQHFPEFAEYARRVPRLVPTLNPPGKQRWEFSRSLYLKHREYNASLGALAIMAALLAKWLWVSR